MVGSRTALWVAMGGLLACGASLGCAGANLAVRVREPDGRAAVGATVRLLAADQPLCSDASLLVGETDARGLARFVTEACGPSRVVAIGANASTANAVLDTCERRVLGLQLQPFADAAATEDGAALTARSFAIALAHQDWAHVEALLADPASLTRYRQAGGALERASSVSWARVPPRAFRVAAHASETDRARVELRLLYDDGCERRLQFELAHVSPGWRVEHAELPEGGRD